MNILYLTNHLEVGGITSYVLSLAEGFKQQGHNVHIGSSGGGLLPEFTARGVPFLDVPARTKFEFHYGLMLSLPRVIRYIKENNIHIIHSNTRVTQVLGCLAGRYSLTPHVSTCHGFFKNRLSRRIFPCWGCRVIAISQEVAGHLAGDLGVRQECIRLIHNGVDIDRFSLRDEKIRENAREKLGLGQAPVVGIIARLSEVKGHSYLIEAMKQVLEKAAGARLLIVGEGKCAEALRNLVRRLKIENNVSFIPNVADTAGILASMDLFVLPSLQEGLGLSLMEAMASGLAVIGSDVGGIKSLIRHGHNGLLVRPKDIEGLSSAILQLLADEERRISFGNRAREFIRENFSRQDMIARTERVYAECLSAKD